MEINNICKRAVDTFGPEHQTMKAVEEMGELMAALVQYNDGRVSSEDVMTEIADVMIMMEQLAFIFDPRFVGLEYNRKISRLKSILEDEQER